MTWRPSDEEIAETLGRPSVTCPDCGATSYNASDVRYGYCGRCHADTIPRTKLGKVLTDQALDDLVAEAERGYNIESLTAEQIDHIRERKRAPTEGE